MRKFWNPFAMQILQAANKIGNQDQGGRESPLDSHLSEIVEERSGSPLDPWSGIHCIM